MKCECGGTVRGIRSFGRLWTYCTKCTPIVKIKETELKFNKPMRPPKLGLTKDDSTAIMVRIHVDDLKLLQRAARKLGLHRATFIRMAAIERAHATLEEK